MRKRFRFSSRFLWFSPVLFGFHSLVLLISLRVSPWFSSFFSSLLPISPHFSQVLHFPFLPSNVRSPILNLFSLSLQPSSWSARIIFASNFRFYLQQDTQLGNLRIGPRDKQIINRMRGRGELIMAGLLQERPNRSQIGAKIKLKTIKNALAKATAFYE